MRRAGSQVVNNAVVNSAMPSAELLNKYKTEIAGLRLELSKNVDERVRPPSASSQLE